MKRIVDRFYYKCAIEYALASFSSYKLLIGSFEFTMKPVEILLVTQGIVTSGDRLFIRDQYVQNMM